MAAMWPKENIRRARVRPDRARTDPRPAAGTVEATVLDDGGAHATAEPDPAPVPPPGSEGPGLVPLQAPSNVSGPSRQPSADLLKTPWSSRRITGQHARRSALPENRVRAAQAGCNAVDPDG